MKVKNMVVAALLTAIAIVIPMISFKIVIPPFSATFASHVPIMLAMFISPVVAAIVSLGSALGFLITLGPVISARAAMHVFFAVVGALMIKKGSNVYLVGFVTMFIHAFAEALIVLPFGFTLQNAGVVVGVGTLLHHTIDFAMTMVIYAALQKAGVFKKFAVANS